MESEALDSGALQGWVPVTIQGMHVAPFRSGEDVTVQMVEGTLFERDNSGPRVRKGSEGTFGRFIHENVFIFA